MMLLTESGVGTENIFCVCVHICTCVYMHACAYMYIRVHHTHTPHRSGNEMTGTQLPSTPHKLCVAHLDSSVNDSPASPPTHTQNCAKCVLHSQYRVPSYGHRMHELCFQPLNYPPCLVSLCLQHSRHINERLIFF